MATWMTHLRIADHILDRIGGLCAAEFLAGNIGPDCGEPNRDWSAFSPPREVSHWYGEGGATREEEFYDTYVAPRAEDGGRFSFYLGYYVHLLADIDWGRWVYYPKKELFAAEFDTKDSLVRAFKRDWYDIDHMFLHKNPGFRAFGIFSGITGFENIYLDYYSWDALQKQIDYISGFYRNHEGSLEHEYPYLNKAEMDAFVADAIADIGGTLRGKGIQ
jgi:hypothetical protein